MPAPKRRQVNSDDCEAMTEAGCAAIINRLVREIDSLLLLADPKESAKYYITNSDVDTRVKSARQAVDSLLKSLV